MNAVMNAIVRTMEETVGAQASASSFDAAGLIRTIVSVIYILVSVALVILVLMQEGKTKGLGSISGAAESYWGKNKGKSMEGVLVKTTRVLAVIFLILTLLLDMTIF